MLYDPYQKDKNLDTFYALIQAIFAMALLLTTVITLFLI